ncbi:DEAD/DEAH box helicase [Flavivirga jejuensis]|uniref:SNF2-related protein n=1 Tax=Flavivirga jejuensis TaxID=870487 RepID=A0ABT8WJF5_9FLAO|nr:SNF2-related protein [Flavivirga jejuensis]MDO5973290.1 SNF2-related protein [Flavivirga jejuensis]
MVELVRQAIKLIEEDKLLSSNEIENAKNIFEQYDHVLLSQGKENITILIDVNKDLFSVKLVLENDVLCVKINGSYSEWNVPSLVALYVVESEIDTEDLTEGIKYSKEGMQKRVLEEREDRAKKADYKVNLANNLYGEHTLINEKGNTYKVTLRDFKNKIGYVNNVDWKTNKLGTTKHIMYLFNYLEQNTSKVKRLKKTYPFIEIFTDPLNNYKISWFFPEKLEKEEETLLKDYFKNNNSIEDNQIAAFSSFLYKSRDLERIKIREEVFEKVEHYFENETLEAIKKSSTLNFSSIKANLYPYQKEGVEFSVFKKGVIVADEMGLGKTLQAIATAILKKEVFNFKKTLVICPASVKHQWKNEILKFSNENAVVVEGYPDIRNGIYSNDSSFFHIVNYETILRDLPFINKSGYDFVILDEAQKIKNYETKTANAVKAIERKHALVITGTPLENKLLDLYSIVQFLDQKFLAPQWEFSYQHCIFDSKHKNKIRGYYNLQNLKKRLSSILIRREKQEVFKQLPNVIQKDIFVSLSDEQENLHNSFARGIASILAKKFKTAYDWQKLMHLLTNMRMVCDSSYLIDKETHCSPKLIELKDILLDKLDVKNTDRKIIIFSEWVTMLGLIGDMLKKENITFTMLTGKVPVKKRGALIKEFEDNPDCRIFLSSESGGAGLNLQIADTVINFELPWNPAKKNQRIGRIDRIGQQQQKLYVFNLLSYNSIEMKIAAGLLLKQNLFEGVLNSDNHTDEVDFSEKGKSQFIKQLEEIIKDDDFESSIETNEIETLIEEDLEHENLEEVVSEIETESNNAKRLEENTVKKEASIEVQANQKTEPNYEQMEEVMTKGMDFLTGIFKMSTGNDLSANGKPKVKVNKETGEVSISFKMDF